MQLINHLSDEELTELLLESEQKEMQQALGSLPDFLRSAAERPEWFWQRQQACIRGRIAAEHAWFRPLITWAGALALIILALLLLNSGPAPKAVQAQTDPDQELVVAVEESVESEVPAALEPAALLAEEISNHVRPVPAPHRASKENQNED
jgi:hypothetical protein